ncbi:glycosyltransferase family 4 protein [Tenacibaculum sp. M341]|uniref:glycosyltransferase family 4 protein n=1 Tax=Tenacibaculum sp. M341 TaxID=2530339 RepID=UPI0010491F3F|nr:glycosyltransferase family 4 protein [Tenacibaculum sp. M341]TCI85050.1 glycosyltransferase [Tenacibaculum sp. M341]
MNNKPILIHTHFHKRKTGITRSIENILPYVKDQFDTFIYGYNVEGEKISRKQLLKLLYSGKNVVVHCHRNNEMLRFLLLKIVGAKFKLISTRHAETQPSGLSRFLFKKSDALVTLTEKMNVGIGIPNTLIPHGVDTNLFVPQISKSTTENSQKIRVLCAGRIRKAKGQETLVNAIVPVLKSAKHVELLIIGKIDNEKYVENLQRIITENGVEDQVTFLKETRDIISYYQSSKIVVVPSHSEGFSLVCAEAMSCGVTTVATRGVGIHSKLIADKKTGYLFEPENVNELQSILSGLINESLPYISEEARSAIQHNWSAQKEATSLGELYLSL